MELSEDRHNSSGGAEEAGEGQEGIEGVDWRYGSVEELDPSEWQVRLDHCFLLLSITFGWRMLGRGAGCDRPLGAAGGWLSWPVSHRHMAQPMAAEVRVCLHVHSGLPAPSNSCVPCLSLHPMSAVCASGAATLHTHPRQRHNLRLDPADWLDTSEGGHTGFERLQDRLQILLCADELLFNDNGRAVVRVAATVLHSNHLHVVSSAPACSGISALLPLPLCHCLT